MAGHTLLLLAGMALGRLIDQAGFGSFVADVVLVPFLGTAIGAAAALAGAAVVIPMLIKRVVGNAPPDRTARPRLHTAAVVRLRRPLDGLTPC